MAYIYLACPTCGEELIELALTYEPDDPDVGIRGGYVLDQDLPPTCPNLDCQHKFSPEELTALEDKANSIVASYEPPDYYDDY